MQEQMQELASSNKRKPSWLKDLVNEAEQSVGPPKREIRESTTPERFCSYMAMLITTIDSEPSTFEEANSHQVWRDAMMEEYTSIMKNDVWEIVPRPDGKSMMTSK